jgi:hypothetical protein
VRRQVRQSIRRAADRETHTAKTSYILATRRGEREQAVESTRLEHGLLTYVLLQGMGKRDLRPLEPRPEIFRQYPTADLDGDGQVTTGELRQYADMAVPVLIDQFPDLVYRGPQATPGDNRSSTPREPEYSQESEASSSFPLIRVQSR